MVQLLFEEFHIALGFFGEVIPALAAGKILLPAGQHGDHRLHPVKVGQRVEAGDFHAIQLVTGDDRDLLHAAEDIQLGEGDFIRALTGQTVAAGYAVKGADPAGTAGGRAMFDLLRNAALILFKFNADGQPNPVILTDDAGVLLPDNKFAVNKKLYDRFVQVFQKQEKVKMYLASGYCKYHGYDEGSMDVVEYHYNQHLGLPLIYELPDTVKQKVTEAEAYSTVWDIQMKLQHALPRSVVYYGQDTLKDGGTRYDELGVFLPLEHFADRLERHVETATKIVYGE